MQETPALFDTFPRSVTALEEGGQQYSARSTHPLVIDSIHAFKASTVSVWEDEHDGRELVLKRGAPGPWTNDESGVPAVAENLLGRAGLSCPRILVHHDLAPILLASYLSSTWTSASSNSAQERTCIECPDTTATASGSESEERRLSVPR